MGLVSQVKSYLPLSQLQRRAVAVEAWVLNDLGSVICRRRGFELFRWGWWRRQRLG